MVVHIVSASINTASDLIIVILPQPVIWRLELTRKRKWGLSAVFLLGGLYVHPYSHTDAKLIR